MKLVEVVILVGSQCISPLQEAPQTTEAGKVQCAVLIHRDTETGAFAVVPPAGYSYPEVRMALERSLKTGAGSAGPSVMADPPPQPPPEEAAVVTPPRTTVIAPQPAEEPDQAADAPAPAPEQQQVASLDEPPASGKIAARYTEPAASTGEGVDLTQAAADAAKAAESHDSAPVEETVVAVEEAPPPEAEAPEPKPAAASRSKSKTKSLTKRSSKQKTAARTVPAPAGYRDKCGKTRVARWYTNSSGQKKYRCVLPGKKNIY